MVDGKLSEGNVLAQPGAQHQRLQPLDLNHRARNFDQYHRDHCATLKKSKLVVRGDQGRRVRAKWRMRLYSRFALCPLLFPADCSCRLPTRCSIPYRSLMNHIVALSSLNLLISGFIDRWNGSCQKSICRSGGRNKSPVNAIIKEGNIDES